MDILYTCDNNYVWLMGISVISLFKNNLDIQNLHVWLLGESISKENKKILDKIGKKYNRKITVIDVHKLEVPHSLISTRWPVSAFTRLYAGILLPEAVEKILYLDCDTIIVGSLSGIDEYNFSEKLFLGVKDCIGKEYKKNIGIGSEGIYINAGVLLINLRELRKIDVSSLLNLYVFRYEKLINYADQDVLNGLFQKYIGVLPPNYNVMTILAVYTYDEILKLRRPTNYYSKNEIQSAIDKPIIIHFTTNMKIIRPWYSNTNHPLSKEFQNYLSISPWKNIKTNKMVFSNNESKIISIIEKLPKNISYIVLGILHSNFKPIYIRIKKLFFSYQKREKI